MDPDKYKLTELEQKTHKKADSDFNCHKYYLCCNFMFCRIFYLTLFNAYLISLFNTSV